MNAFEKSRKQFLFQRRQLLQLFRTSVFFSK